MEIGPSEDFSAFSAVFTRSASIEKIGAALAKAQGMIGHAKADSINPHFKSHYADLASLVDAVGPALSACEIARYQAPFTRGEEVGVYTMLIHAGEHLGCEITCTPSQRTPIAIGTVISYLRRYSLAAVTGTAQGQVDDDGNLGSGKAEAPQATPPAQTVQRTRAKPPKLAPEEPPAPAKITPESSKTPLIEPGVVIGEIPAGKVPVFEIRAGRWEQTGLADPLSATQQARVKILQKELGIDADEWVTKLVVYYGKTSSKQLTAGEAETLAARLERRKAAQLAT